MSAALPTQAMVDAAVRTARQATGEVLRKGAPYRHRHYAFHALVTLFPKARDRIVRMIGVANPGTFLPRAAESCTAAWWREVIYVRVANRLKIAVERHHANERSAERRAEMKAVEDARRKADRVATMEAKAKAKAAAERAAAPAQAVVTPAPANSKPAAPTRIYTRMPQERTAGRGLVTAKPQEWWTGLPAPLTRRQASVTAAFCGDPPPGRSALDQRQGGRP